MFSAQSVKRTQWHEIYLNSATRNRKLTRGTDFHHGCPTYHLRAGLTAAVLTELQLSFMAKTPKLQKKNVKMNLRVNLQDLNAEQCESEGVSSHIPDPSTAFPKMI